MAKNRNTYAKQQRDIAKKRKAADKRERRANRKKMGNTRAGREESIG